MTDVSSLIVLPRTHNLPHREKIHKQILEEFQRGNFCLERNLFDIESGRTPFSIKFGRPLDRCQRHPKSLGDVPPRRASPGDQLAVKRRKLPRSLLA